jgi:hypothetical protein
MPQGERARGAGAVCLLAGFGDSSANLELGFCIQNPTSGRAERKS